MTALELEETRASLLSRIARVRRQLDRRIKAVRGDLQKGEEAMTTAERARLFVAEAAKAPRGTTRLVATDWSTGEPVPREMELQPDETPRAQVEAVFARGRRMKRGVALAEQRIAEALEKLGRLESLGAALVAAMTLEEALEAVATVRREDPALLPAERTQGPPGSAPKQARRLPYRTFIAPSGERILVGRGASDNDELTLHVARPRDLWLHVRGQSGAHVVVPLKKGHEPTPGILVDAAHLAAHFSDARGETVVDVTYAPRRYVRKPRRSPPGLVVVDREKTLALVLDAGRLAGLLAREEV